MGANLLYKQSESVWNEDIPLWEENFLIIIKKNE